MQHFEDLRQYVFLPEDEKASEKKHNFFALSREDILGAEERLGLKFPSELRQFYALIGYGFLWNTNQDMIDRIMDPGSVADFRRCECMYGMNEPWEHYDKNYLVFFEVSEVSYIAMDLNQENANGQCPIYYFDQKIANSLEEFIHKMDAEVDYYLMQEVNQTKDLGDANDV